MCKIGPIEYLRQAGKVSLHEQNSLSDNTYQKLKGAKSMIGNYIKDTSLKVDIYDANTLPPNEFVYGDFPNQVRVKVTKLLDDKVEVMDFVDKENPKKEPFLRQIFAFIDEQSGVKERKIDDVIFWARYKYSHFLNKKQHSKEIQNKVVEKYDVLPKKLKQSAF